MFDAATVNFLKTVDTPFYYYDLSLLRRTLDLYTAELNKYKFKAHYALKANANNRILKLIKSYDLGADCVSGNEVSLALNQGFDPKSIVYAGVGKTDKEIETAIAGDIFSVNCESIPEIEVVNQIAGRMNKTAPVSLRINPDIDPHTHEYISTGRSKDKFGISYRVFDELIDIINSCTNIKLVGLHFHVGSQITDMKVFELLADRVNEISLDFERKGLNIETINLGGGLGVDYTEPNEYPIPDFSAYFSIFNKKLKRRSCQQIHFEPGRAIVAQCGSLISKVLYVKIENGDKIVILDAGMNDLIRPALYQATHKVENLTSLFGNLQEYDVVGPVCESSDKFGQRLLLPETMRGDIFALRSAGAYGQVMAMRYNQRDIAKDFYSE